jgi:ribonuclease HII
MLYFERKYRKQGYKTVVGVDEVGIGPLAGPVVAAAVVLGKKRFKYRIDDSKQLTPLQRQRAYLEITESSSVGISVINEKIIDRLNIAQATRIAMEEAVARIANRMVRLSSASVMVLIDGIIKPHLGYPSVNIVKGDARSKSIAAASIVAKVTRDRIMEMYDRVYPSYGFHRHKGYPTRIHRNALNKFGRSLIHRVSYCGG